MRCSYIHDEIRRRINRNNKADGQYASALDIDSCVNYAKDVWYSNRIEKREVDSEIREELRNFEKSNFKLDIIKKQKDVYAVKLPADFYQKSFFKVLAKKDFCECEKYLTPIIIKGDNFNNVIKDPDRKSSFEYEEILYDEKNDGVYFYTDGSFQIVEITLDYFIKINDLNCPSELIDRDYYNDQGKIIKRDVPFPLFNKNSLHDIMDIASYVFLGRVKDTQLQATFNLIKNKYNL